MACLPARATPPDAPGPFTPDAAIAARAKYHADVLVRTARALYGVKLDYSDASIETFEQILNALTKDGFGKAERIVRRIDAQSARPPEELPGFADLNWNPRDKTPLPTRQSGQPSMNFCDAAGGYIGETLRRNHDAEWGIITYTVSKQRFVYFSVQGAKYPYYPICAPYENAWRECANDSLAAIQAYYHRCLKTKLGTEE
jgi:hypothetical protein